MRARAYVREAAPAPGVQTVDGWPWVRKYSLPAADTETTTPRSGARAERHQARLRPVGVSSR
jgi:hypothetical protein